MHYRSLLALVALLVAPATAVAHILPMDDAMAVMDVVHEHVAHSDDFDISIVAEGKYAITFWKPANGRPGGSALLDKVAGTWHLIKMQASQFSSAAQLQSLGVPDAQAKALVADLAK